MRKKAAVTFPKMYIICHWCASFSPIRFYIQLSSTRGFLLDNQSGVINCSPSNYLIMHLICITAAVTFGKSCLSFHSSQTVHWPPRESLKAEVVHGMCFIDLFYISTLVTLCSISKNFRKKEERSEAQGNTYV